MQCWRTKGKFISQFALWQLPLVVLAYQALPANFVHSLFTFSASWQPSPPPSTLHLRRKLISPSLRGKRSSVNKTQDTIIIEIESVTSRRQCKGGSEEFALPAEGLETDIKRCQVLSNSIAGETSPSSSSPASLLSFALCNSN